MLCTPTHSHTLTHTTRFDDDNVLIGIARNEKKEKPTLDASKDAKLPHNRRSMLLVIRLVVTVAVEIGQATQQTSTVPHCIPLHLVANDIDFQPGTAHLAACGGFARCKTLIYDGAQIFFKTLTKVLKHSGASAEDDIFVKASTDVDGRLLDDAIHDFGKRGEEVRRGDFRVEEDLGGEETLVSDVKVVFLASVTGTIEVPEGTKDR